MKTFPAGTKVINLNEGWIQGNEPGEDGKYEITCRLEQVEDWVEIGFYTNKRWVNIADIKIIAYKIFKFSSPYIEPEPELLCPACDQLGKLETYIEGNRFECIISGCMFRTALQDNKELALGNRTIIYEA